MQKIYTAASSAEVVKENIVRNEPGRPLGGFYGYISDGVDPETGNLIYRDLNEDGKISTSDRTYIGDPNPDFIYGLTNTFTWKDLSLSIFIQGSYGNDIFNVSRMETEGMYDGKNQSTEVLKRWRIPRTDYECPESQLQHQELHLFCRRRQLPACQRHFTLLQHPLPPVQEMGYQPRTALLYRQQLADLDQLFRYGPRSEPIWQQRFCTGHRLWNLPAEQIIRFRYQC